MSTNYGSSYIFISLNLDNSWVENVVTSILLVGVLKLRG